MPGRFLAAVPRGSDPGGETEEEEDVVGRGLGDDIVAFANPTPLPLSPPLREEFDASGASRNCCLLLLLLFGGGRREVGGGVCLGGFFFFVQECGSTMGNGVRIW